MKNREKSYILKAVIFLLIYLSYVYTDNYDISRTAHTLLSFYVYIAAISVFITTFVLKKYKETNNNLKYRNPTERSISIFFAYLAPILIIYFNDTTIGLIYLSFIGLIHIRENQNNERI